MTDTKRPSGYNDLPEFIKYENGISPLSAPLCINGRQIPNRICYQPMEGADGSLSGTPGHLTVRRYDRFARGGAGLIWFEATAIVPEGRANPHQMYITEKNVDDFARLVEDTKNTCIKENGYEPIIICQLTHSGRWSKNENGRAPMIAYSKPMFEKDSPIDTQNIVTDSYLDSLPERYVSSARLCEKAGFDGVDIKACHGYLLSELLSAYRREGKYGGDLENRARLLFDSTEAVRGALDDSFIVGSRFNMYDGYAYPDGIGDSGKEGIPDFTEGKMIAKGLSERGATLLNITMGCPYTNNEVNRPTSFAKSVNPYESVKRMLDGAREAKLSAPDCAVVVSGISFLSSLAPEVCAYYINKGDFDMAGFGRQSFAYPELARDILKSGKMKDKSTCLTCGKCTELMRGAEGAGCPVYDKEAYLDMYRRMGEK